MGYIGADVPRPFQNLGQQLQAVKAAALGRSTGAAPDPRLVAIEDHSRVLAGPSGGSESVGSDGGFTVQKDFSNELLTNVWQTGKLAARARHIPIGENFNGIKLNVIDETSRADGSRWGAVQAYWVAEAAALTGSRPKFRPIEMTLAKLIGLYYATDELLRDDVALSAVATEAFTEEFGFKIDDAMMRGTGAGTPLGILNSGALVTVPKETNQSAATIVAENIMKMWSRMPSGSLDNACWFINQETWPQIFQLALAIGTGGIPLFLPAGQFNNAPNGTLLGKPIVPIEQASALGTAGDISFCDFSQYLLIEAAGGIQAASSIHVLFLTDEMTFRWTLRTNGQPKQVAPITPYKGTATLSPFVTLGAR
jgi:HK97 family phage major capsid protein